MRLACLRVPLFALAARLRAEPELLGQPLVICEGSGSAARVHAASRPARQAAIKPGMTLAHARSMVADLVARGRDQVAEQAAHEALLEAASSVTPRYEDAGFGLSYLDLTGLDRIYAEHSNPELAIGRSAQGASRRLGLETRVGIASSKLAARVASRLNEDPTVIPEGEEASFLAPLPLGLLDPQLNTAETLTRWGLQSIGDFAALPAAEIACRLGEIGRALHQAARGIDPLPLLPSSPPATLAEGAELEWPASHLEPFLASLECALERLSERLTAIDRGCARLELEMQLEPEGHERRSLRLPAPGRSVKSLRALLATELEARPPGGPVLAFTLLVWPDRPRLGQLELFGPPSLPPDALATALVRLAAELGVEAIGSPRVEDGHLPERWGEAEFAPPPPPKMNRPRRPSRSTLR